MYFFFEMLSSSYLIVFMLESTPADFRFRFVCLFVISAIGNKNWLEKKNENSVGQLNAVCLLGVLGEQNWKNNSKKTK